MNSQAGRVGGVKRVHGHLGDPESSSSMKPFFAAAFLFFTMAMRVYNYEHEKEEAATHQYD